MVLLKNYFVNTTAEVDFLPITHDIRYAVKDSGAQEGLVTVIVPGAGAGLAIFEPIPEVIEELRVAFELFAGESAEALNKKKEPTTPASHVQAAIIGRQLSIPLASGNLVLESYEEIYLIDFGRKAKRREFFVQVFPEPPPPPQAAGRAAPPKKK